jgi:hypothetical protein
MALPSRAPDPERLHWHEVAAQQDGVLARWQALAAGMTAHAWEWRLGRFWTRALPGVAVLHTGEITPRQGAWAAVLHGGPQAHLSGDAALRELGMKRLVVSSYDVVVPHRRTVVPSWLAGGSPVTPHRLRQSERWSSSQRGLPLLSVHACVLHAAAWATSDRWAEHRLASAVQQRKTVPSLLRPVLAQMPKHPRLALVRDVLDDLELGARARSELDFLRFCRAHGLPEPDVLQLQVRTGQTSRYLDAYYRRQRLALEIDGAYHLLVETWDADALRSLELAVARVGSGENLVRLTASNLRHDGAKVAALLRPLLLR